MRSILPVLLLGLCAAGCAGPSSDTGPPDGSIRADTLTGTVVYRERIALPPEAVVRVTLEDVSRADAPAVVLAEQTIRPDGRQVPIPFALAFDSAGVDPQGRYVVRAVISDADGRLRWTSDTAHPVLTDDAPSADVQVRVRRATDASADTPTRSQTIWAEAQRQGVDFRAVGNEPGWVLDLFEADRIRFVYDYGQQEAVVPAPEPTVAAEQTVYHAETEAHTLTVTITETPCTDTMSGERFETTVTVELDGRAYRGCGRSLE